MDQIKIGGLLKALRNEKQLTQEQLAEVVGVSRRTVSRWETGSNLPDLDILIELADYYQVELRELLDGERKDKQVNPEVRQTALMVADYSNEEKQRIVRGLHATFILGLIAALVYGGLMVKGLADSPVAQLCLGFTTGILLLGVVMTSKHAAKLRACKARLLRRLKGEKE